MFANEFDPVAAGIGGVLIGLSALWMLAVHGRIAGISGIAGGLLDHPRTDSAWRAAFVLGLVGAGLVARLVWPEVLTPGLVRSPVITVAAGLLVGFGARLGSGCTSGHGICGVGRLSARSLIATGTFMATAALTVWLYTHAGGR